jgi:hypothetical protein
MAGTREAGGWAVGFGLVLVFGGLAAGPAPGQEASPRRPPGAAPDPAKAATADSPAPTELPVDPVIWPEPRRAELLRNDYPEIPGPVMSDRDRNALVARIGEMAQGRGLDRADIKRFVDYNVAELTRRSNIAAMRGETEGAGRNPRALDEAASRLIAPLIEAPTPANQSFRREYVARLLDHQSQILKGNLLSRSFYMVVLSRAGMPEVVPVLIEQIRDPEQAYTVKLLAAVGLTTATDNGRRPLDANTYAVPAARAVADFLRNSADAPWPVQVRCLEALGALRQSTENPLTGAAELAGAAFEFLANPELDPLVRAWAGRSLSRLVYPSQVRGLNLELVAYELGRASVAAGEKLVALPVPDGAPTRNLKLAARWIEPLLRALEAFVGDEQIRGSGLNAMTNGGGVVRGVEQRIRALATAAVRFSQSAGAQVRPAQLDVEAALEELRSYLAKNVPANAEFYPGGPVADLPAAGTPAARATGGR